MPLAPWCAAEKWEYWIVSGKRYAKVTGRQRCPAESWRNIAWGWRNDYEQSIDQAPWFEPNKPRAERERDWAARNPLQNARLFVLGVADRNYSVEVLQGNPDPMVVQRNDVGELGWQKARLFAFEDGSKDRYFASYSGKHLVLQWGCQPSGFFGAKLNMRV